MCWMFLFGKPLTWSVFNAKSQKAAQGVKRTDNVNTELLQ